MAEEIFGPLLPLVPVDGLDEAIEEVNGRAKPLALYVFSNDPQTRRAFAERTSSGALCFDVPAAHLSVPGLPFGGVGGSGMGAYHGEHSVRTFSHERPTLDKPLWPDTLELIYPPYTRTKHRIIDALVAPVGKRAQEALNARRANGRLQLSPFARSRTGASSRPAAPRRAGPGPSASR